MMLRGPPLGYPLNVAPNDWLLTLFVPGGGENLPPPLSYFNIASKRKTSFTLMHPDFESNLITHIFRKFGESETPGSDVIFAFLRHPRSFMQF